MDILGKSPVPLPFLILGKLAFAGCWLFFIVKFLTVDTMLYDSAATRATGIALFAVGSALALLALVHLGRSAAVGFPDRMTELKTHGVYRISRNPVYLGGFLTCAGSCLFSIHPLNVLLCAIAIAIHHWIVKKEEQFLEERFGKQWREYCGRVPRYIGRTGKHG